VNWYRRMVTFIQEVVAELKRATWPSWPEVRGTTTVVIIAIFIFAVFLYAVDLGLGYLFRMTLESLR